eukprot:6199746-Pleurochrysis_carterae.AAC.1
MHACPCRRPRRARHPRSARPNRVWPARALWRPAFRLRAPHRRTIKQARELPPDRSHLIRGGGNRSLGDPRAPLPPRYSQVTILGLRQNTVACDASRTVFYMFDDVAVLCECVRRQRDENHAC